MAKMNWDRVRRERGLDRAPLEADEPAWMISEESRRKQGSPKAPSRKVTDPSPRRQTRRNSDTLAQHRQAQKAAAKRRRQAVGRLPSGAFAPADATREAWALLLQRLTVLPEPRRLSAIGWYSATRHVLKIGGGAIEMSCDVDNPAFRKREPRRVYGLDAVLKEMARDIRWAEGFILLGPQNFSKKELRVLGAISAQKALSQ